MSGSCIIIEIECFIAIYIFRPASNPVTNSSRTKNVLEVKMVNSKSDDGTIVATEYLYLLNFLVYCDPHRFVDITLK